MYEELEATIRLGKAGITDGIVEEIKAQLDTRRMVKIKVLRSARHPGTDIKDMARDIADRCGGKVAQVKGFTIVLEK